MSTNNLTNQINNLIKRGQECNSLQKQPKNQTQTILVLKV